MQLCSLCLVFFYAFAIQNHRENNLFCFSSHSCPDFISIASHLNNNIICWQQVAESNSRMFELTVKVLETYQAEPQRNEIKPHLPLIIVAREQLKIHEMRRTRNGDYLHIFGTERNGAHASIFLHQFNRMKNRRTPNKSQILWSFVVIITFFSVCACVCVPFVLLYTC